MYVVEIQDQIGLMFRIYSFSRRTANGRKPKIPNFQIRCTY